jgi:hypothetical protein
LKEVEIARLIRALTIGVCLVIMWEACLRKQRDDLIKATLEHLDHYSDRHIPISFIQLLVALLIVDRCCPFCLFHPLTALDNQPRVHFAGLTPLIIRESPHL